MLKRRITLGALLWISTMLAVRSWAWEAEVITRWDMNSAAVDSGRFGAVPMQNHSTRFRAECMLYHREVILAGWSWDMSLWGQLDSLPSENPLALPESKLAGSSRFLELTSSYELSPGRVVLDAGKKVSHPSAGFFKTPLNLLQRPPLFSETSAKAIGVYEEGWVGAGVTYFSRDFTVSNYLSPRMEWNAETHQALAYLTSPQEQWQDQVLVSWRMRTADVKLMGLAKTSDGHQVYARYGLGLESQLGEGVTLRAEGAVSDELERQKVTDPAGLTHATETLTWVPRALAGFTYTSPEQWTVMVEYYFNGLGYWGDGYQDIIRYTRNRPVIATPPTPDLLNPNGYFETSRHYGFARIAKSLDDKTAGEAWSVINLYDGSGAGGFMVTRTWDTWSILASWMTFFGRDDTEAGCSPFLNQLALEMKLFI